MLQDAQPPEPWIEPLDATKEGQSFVNKNYVTNQMEGQLDAMHVNVYTKNIKPSKLLPVMVFIHGGGFLSGSGRSDLYGPDYFMQKEMVLVTLNYRLNVFGIENISFFFNFYLNKLDKRISIMLLDNFLLIKVIP